MFDLSPFDRVSCMKRASHLNNQAHHVYPDWSLVRDYVFDERSKSFYQTSNAPSNALLGASHIYRGLWNSSTFKGPAMRCVMLYYFKIYVAPPTTSVASIVINNDQWQHGLFCMMCSWFFSYLNCSILSQTTNKIIPD